MARRDSVRGLVCTVGVRVPTEEALPRVRLAERVREIVGGWFDMVALADGENGGTVAAYINDEGVIRHLPINRVVSTRSAVWSVAGPTRELPIHGDFFVCGLTMHGNERSLTDDELAVWKAKLTARGAKP